MAEHVNPVTGDRVIDILEEPRLTAAVEADLGIAERDQAVESILNHSYEDADYYQRAREMAADAKEDNANAATLGLSPADVDVNKWTIEAVGEAIKVEPLIRSETMVVEHFGPASDQDKKNMDYYLKSFDTVAGMYYTEVKNDINYNAVGYNHASSHSRNLWYGENGQGGSLAQLGAEFRTAINKNPELAAQFEAKLAALAKQAAVQARRIGQAIDPNFDVSTAVNPHFGSNFDPRNPKPIVIAGLESDYAKNAAGRDPFTQHESIIKYNMLVEVSRIARAGSIHELRANYHEKNGFTSAELYDAADSRADDAINYFNANDGEIEPGTVHRFFQDMVAMSDYINSIDGALAQIALNHDVTTRLAKAELTVARANAFERMNQLRYRQQELIMACAQEQGMAIGSPRPDYSGQLVGLAPSKLVQPDNGILLSDSNIIMYEDGTYGLYGRPAPGSRVPPIHHMDKYGAQIEVF